MSVSVVDLRQPSTAELHVGWTILERDVAVERGESAGWGRLQYARHFTKEHTSGSNEVDGDKLSNADFGISKAL